MPDDIHIFDAADEHVEKRAKSYFNRLGVSELDYPQILEISTQHALLVRPAPAVADQPWISIGPRNVGGRIISVAQDPTDSLVLYAGSAHGGLWRTINAGDEWEHLGDAQHTFPVGAIAVPAQRPDLVYLGTGSKMAQYVSGRGFYVVSVPGPRFAATFTRIAFAPDSTTSPRTVPANSGKSLRYTQIEVDPEEPLRFWVASQTGLWRCTVAGPPFTGTWVREFPPAAGAPAGTPQLAQTPDSAGLWPNFATDVAVALDPRQSERVTVGKKSVARYLVIYVAIDSVGIFRGQYDRSSDRTSWEKKLNVPNVNLQPGNTNQFTRILLTLCRHDPKNVYAVFATVVPGGLPADNHASQVFRSNDSGENWAAGAHPIPIASGYTTRPGQADYDLVLEVNPENPNVLICGEIDLCKSEDAGDHWTPILQWQNYDTGDYSQHADQHTAMFDVADRRKLWAGNDGGLSMADDLRSVPGSPRFWRKRSHGIIAGQFQDVTVHPTAALSHICGGGLQDNGTYISYGGPTWYHIGWADGAAMAIHANNSREFIVGQDNFVVMNSIAAVVPPGGSGLIDPVIPEFPAQQNSMIVRVEGYNTPGPPGTGPFVPRLEQDPVTAGRVLVGWARATGTIAVIAPPPPGLPLPPPPPPLVLPANPVGGVPDANTIAGEESTAVAFGPVIPGVANVDGWIGTDRGQLFFSTNAPLAGWAAAPALPIPAARPVQITRVTVHPRDPRIVAVSSVPTSPPGTQPIVIRIAAAGAVGVATFTYTIGALPASAAQNTAATFDIPATFIRLQFGGAGFNAGDFWTIAPTGAVTPNPGNTSPGNLTAVLQTGGRVHLTYDRGVNWIDITHPAPPRPVPDPAALPPCTVASLKFDLDAANNLSLFAGTLVGVYVTRSLPSPTALAVAPSPVNVPIGGIVQLTANLTLTGVGVQNFTTAADWTSSNLARATVSPNNGQVTGVAAGPVTITARRGTLTATANVNVVAAPPGAPPPAPAPAAAPAVAPAWRPFNLRLPLALVNDIEMVPGTRTLRIATFGRGIWDCNLAGGQQFHLYIRQTLIDRGQTPRAIPAAPNNDDPRLPALTLGLDLTHAADIRVDASPFSFFDNQVDGAEFDQEIGADTIKPLVPNVIYVQVLNSGTDAANSVDVHLYFTQCAAAAAGPPPGAAIPALPNTNNFYVPPSFDPPGASLWQRVAPKQTIGPVRADQPMVARFDWLEPPTALAAAKNVALLALCTAPGQDALPNPMPPNYATIPQLIANEAKSALRIVPVAALPSADVFVRDGIDDTGDLGAVALGARSPDIIVVPAVPADPPDRAFRDLLDERPQDHIQSGVTNQIYVRVRNRGLVAADTEVHIWAVPLDATHTPNTSPAAWRRITPSPNPPHQVVPANGTVYFNVPLPDPGDPNPGDAYKAWGLAVIIQPSGQPDAFARTASITSLDAFWKFFRALFDSEMAALRVLRYA